MKLTSGTTRGTSSLILKNFELSIIIVFFEALGINFSAILLPAAKKVILALSKSYSSKLSTINSLPLKFNLVPLLFSEATRKRLSILSFDLSKISMVFLPTFPVAPIIAKFI